MAGDSHRVAHIFVLVGLFGAVSWPPLVHAAVAFDDSASDRIRISNAYFSLSLSKVNGGILELWDQGSGVQLTQGSVQGCLWGATAGDPANPQFVGGCSFNALGPALFTYSWNAGNSTLLLTFAPPSASPPSIGAVLALIFSDQPYFDMVLYVRNNSGNLLLTVKLPGDLAFAASAVQSAYLPMGLPGVRLKPSFFLGNNFVSTIYPSQLAFADIMGLDVSGGKISLYSVNPSGPTQPVRLALADNSSNTPGTFALVHEMQTYMPSGQTFTSPTVRVRVGQAIQSTVAAYRTDNAIDAYPSIMQKLGANFTAVSRSPVLRADFGLLPRTFDQWIADIGSLRPPAMVQPIAFQPNGQDRNYPDLLPPDPQFGTTADFQRFVSALHLYGFTAMPHTNYTWWDPQSPTLRGVSSLAGLMVQSNAGTPLVEQYGVNSGYVVSPASSFVQNRLASGFSDWGAVGVDSLFLDQIGARPWMPDYNPAASPITSYSDRWLSLSGGSGSFGSSTEGGWDRLSRTMWGFFGSLISGAASFDIQQVRWGIGSPGNNLLGAGNWEPFPLASWMFHDKVLFYQHNLELSSYSSNAEVLSWNALLGLMQLQLWPGTAAGLPDPDYVDLTYAIQRSVSARQAGQPLVDYKYITPDVMQSQFGNTYALGNWQTTTFSLDGNTVIPGGFMAWTGDGAMLAGFFQNSFQNQPLSPGPHAVVMERAPTLVSLRHPVGADTNLSVQVPSAWQNGKPLYAFAVDPNANLIGAVGTAVQGNVATVQALRAVGGTRASRFEIMSTSSIACTDGASFHISPVSPGEAVSLFGSNIGPPVSQQATFDANGALSTQVGGVRVLLNGVPAPLLFASSGQVNAIIPYWAGMYDWVDLGLELNGTIIGSLRLPVVNSVPRIFTANAEGAGQAAAQNLDYSINAPANPVARGSVITLYVTGGGTLTTPIPEGTRAPGANALRHPTRVAIAGVDAQVLYSGAAPGFVGLVQINAVVPASAPVGANIPVVVQIGGAISQSGVTIAVK